MRGISSSLVSLFLYLTGGPAKTRYISDIERSWTCRTLSPISLNMLDVAIVGAGPAGLGAAAALLRCAPNSRVQVFDHVQKFHICGAGLAMRLNGYAALSAIDSKLARAVADLTAPVETSIMHSLDGKVQNSLVRPIPSTQTGIKDLAALGWSELRYALAAEVPASNINLGKRLSHLNPHEDFVNLHFTDDSTVDAKVVVGADGCFSRVRQHTLDDGLPEFMNTVMWRARLTDKDMPKETHWMTGGALMAAYYPISYQGEFVWTVSASSEHLEKAGLEVKQGPSRKQESKENQSPAQHAQHNGQQQAPATQSAKVSPKERCKRVWGANSKLVMDLIDATDESTILEHNLHVRHADSLSQGHWGKGRVTLVGDAAHPMRPASGQGVNQALEDAVELAQAIKEGGLNSDSLRAYESKRIPRVQEIMAAEMVMGLKTYAGCPDELPERLKPFKFATAKWHGTDNGEYEKWTLDRKFEPL